MPDAALQQEIYLAPNVVQPRNFAKIAAAAHRNALQKTLFARYGHRDGAHGAGSGGGAGAASDCASRNAMAADDEGRGGQWDLLVLRDRRNGVKDVHHDAFRAGVDFVFGTAGA